MKVSPSCTSLDCQMKLLWSISIFLLSDACALRSLCSIIFIHGLQGHPRNTWIWESNSRIPEESVPIEQKAKSRSLKFWSESSNKQKLGDTEVGRIASRTMFWPYHLLKDDCPKSRILTWGYDSKVSKFFDHSASKNSVLHHASDLIGDLNPYRKSCVGWRLSQL
jgi:hypothetical protein